MKSPTHTCTIALALALLLPGAKAQDPGKDASPPLEIQSSDYQTLQAALDALPAAGGVVRLAPGRYEITEPLILRTPETRLMGSGASTHIVNLNTEGKPALHLRADDYAENPKSRLWRVQLDGFRVSGSEQSGDGILAEGINEIFIDGVSIDRHGGNGINLVHCYEDPRIADSILTYNKKSGLHIDGGHDIVVNANHFEENQDGITCVDSFNLTANGNNFDDHLGHGIVIENTYGSVVSGNMIEECQGLAMILDRDCYGITISANVIAHELQGGIDLRDAWGCAISANTFTIVHHFGVRVGPDSGRLTITGNNFSNSHVGQELRRKMEHEQPFQLDVGNGVLLEDTEAIVISGNLFGGIDGEAIVTKGDCQAISVTGNVVTDFGRRKETDGPIEVSKEGNLIEDNIVQPAK